MNVTCVDPAPFRPGFPGASLKRPQRRIPEYEHTAVTLTLTRMAARDGQQPNDPKRLARVLMRIVDDPAPPLRLPLGEDSIDRLEKKVAATAAEFAKWKAVSLSVAFDTPDQTLASKS